MDYDQDLISTGGGIFERSAKSIQLTPEIKALTGLASDSVTPDELIHALLKSDCELLWFGGIGTYIKASDESQADAGDRANDSLRINGKDLKAKVVGEGANLGLTQAGRIEAGQPDRAMSARRHSSLKSYQRSCLTQCPAPPLALGHAIRLRRRGT